MVPESRLDVPLALGATIGGDAGTTSVAVGSGAVSTTDATELDAVTVTNGLGGSSTFVAGGGLLPLARREAITATKLTTKRSPVPTITACAKLVREVPTKNREGGTAVPASDPELPC